MQMQALFYSVGFASNDESCAQNWAAHRIRSARIQYVAYPAWAWWIVFERLEKTSMFTRST